MPRREIFSHRNVSAMDKNLVITIILALLAGSSSFATLLLPSSIDGPDETISLKEIKEAERTFARRRLIFAMVTLLMIGAVVASAKKSGAIVTGGFVGGASIMFALYATVLHDNGW